LTIWRRSPQNLSTQRRLRELFQAGMPATVNATMSILQAIRIFFYLLLGTSSLLWCS
jgi:hypothetical protein